MIRDPYGLRFRIGSSVQCTEGKKCMDIACHRTGKGTFIIRRQWVLGSGCYKLLFETSGRKVELEGTYFYPQTAAESISSGEHDGELGFSASSLGVPPKVSEWNGRKPIDGT
jgi:hypothetical protein